MTKAASVFAAASRALKASCAQVSCSKMPIGSHEDEDGGDWEE